MSICYWIFLNPRTSDSDVSCIYNLDLYIFPNKYLSLLSFIDRRRADGQISATCNPTQLSRFMINPNDEK